MTPVTRRDAARAALAGLFHDAGIETADVDARLLLCAACGIDHAALIRDPDVAMGPAAMVLGSMANRRLAREPVSRILGTREFWGLPLAIGPAVLDPRPDTEGLVGSVLDAVGGRRRDAMRILDLGTGSGAILCALLHELPGAYGIGVDRSVAACRVARHNIESLGLSARALIVTGTWADAISARFDIVVSNPPYIPHAEIRMLERDVRDYDPALALDGGDDGLDAYRAITPRLDLLLRRDGVAAVECGWNQAGAVAALLRAVLDGVMVYRDVAGHERVVLGIRRQTSGMTFHVRP